jgi:hypothetical protein
MANSLEEVKLTDLSIRTGTEADAEALHHLITFARA